MSESAAWIVCIAGALGALGYVLSLARKAFRSFEVMANIVKHELTPNSGGSIYDKVTRLDTALKEHLVHSDEMDDRLIAVESKVIG